MFWIFQQLHLGPVINPVISEHASLEACPGIHPDVNYLWRCIFYNGGLYEGALPIQV